jgi:sulfonate transport system substrate-binding protein
MYRSKLFRPATAALAAFALVLTASVTAASAQSTPRHATASSRVAHKENDHGVVINFEGSTTSLDSIDAAGLAPTFTKELAKVGASYQFVGNFASEAPGVQALEGGSLDVVSGSITATIGAWAGNAPVKIIGYGANVATGSAILVPANSPITSVQQLVGKTVGVNQAGSGQYTLDAALNAYNIPISSVQQVFLSPANALAAFGSGQVQAWATFATNIPLAIEKFNAKVLVTAGKVHGQNFSVTVISSTFAAQYPHLTKLIYNILHEAAARVEKNPTLYDNYLRNNSGFDQAEVDYSNSQLTYFDAVTPSVVKKFQNVADLFYKDSSVPVDVTVKGQTIDANNLK